MAQFSVNTGRLREEANALRSAQRTLGDVAGRLAVIQISRALKSSSSVLLSQRIADCNLAALNQALNLGALASGLDGVANLYERNEKALSDPKTAAQATTQAVIDWISGSIDDILPWVVQPGFLPSLLVLSPFLVMGGAAAGLIPESASVLSGGIGGSGSVFGIPCAGELGYSLLGYETDTIGKAEWNTKEGNITAQIGGEAELYIARGSAKGNIGILGGSVEGSFGNVGASGALGITLFENGKFSPYVGIEGKAEASVLKGKAEAYLGDEANNIHGKASGTVLGAEAKAEAKAGVFTEVDEKTGQTVTKYGAKAEVGAEAYLAEGKVSGGFSIFGIDFDVGISGKAGGAGVSAGGEIVSNGVSGELGAGLGLGLGVEFSIDWSDFDPPSMEDIGNGLQEVGSAIGDGLSYVGEGLQDAGNAIADFFGW